MQQQDDRRDSQKKIDEMLARRDLILVTGKGGVGKSSLVAALAGLAAHKRGHSLAVELSASPQLQQLTRGRDDVSCVNIDLDAALMSMLGRMLHIPKILSHALNNRVLKMFAKTSPAARELLLLDEIFEQVQGASVKGWPVIVDLPATGHAVSFLGTPGAVRRMLRVGPVARRAALIEELLRDARRTELLIVAIPEELPVNETIELVQQAQSLALNCRVVLVNQVPDSPMRSEDHDLLDKLHAQNRPELQQTLSATQSHMQARLQTSELIDFLDKSVRQSLLLLSHFSDSDAAMCVQNISRQLLVEDAQDQYSSPDIGAFASSRKAAAS